MLKTLQRTIFERGPGRVLDPSTTCTRSVRLFLRSVAGSSEELESIERYCALGGTVFNSSTPERTHRACLAATTRRSMTTLSSQGTVLRRLLRQLRRRNSQGLKARARGFPREEDKETCRAGTPPRRASRCPTPASLLLEAASRTQFGQITQIQATISNLPTRFHDFEIVFGFETVLERSRDWAASPPVLPRGVKLTREDLRP